ncbi:MAG: hypothetical protein AAGF12_06205 [Myxococcota bacterium]
MTKRLVTDLLISVGVAVVLAVVGGLGALPLAEATIESVGQPNVIMLTPSAPVVLAVKLAGALAAVPLLAWLSTLVFRVRWKTPPSRARTMVAFGLVPAAAVLGMVLRFVSIGWLVDDVGSLGPAPQIDLLSASYAGGILRASCVAALALVAVNLWVPPPAAEPAQSAEPHR